MKKARTKHLKFIRSLPCLVCHNPIQTESAHIRYGDLPIKPHTGKGEKPDDKWTVPLCSRCHREQHRVNERYFWRVRGIDPVKVALELYRNTGNYELCCAICEQHPIFQVTN